jgi:pilus assembly protein CpaE
VVSTPEALVERVNTDTEEILVLLGPSTSIEDALGFAEQCRVRRPALGVVLLREEVDLDLMTDALRAGVREVVRTGDHAAVLAACARSRDLSRQLILRSQQARQQSETAEPPPPPEVGPREGEVVTVFSAKGGCGKTTIATNLAVALADGGNRRVCLIDLDLAFGDVAIMLQLVPERSIADAVGLGDQLDETSVRALLTPYGPGLDTLLAPAGPAEAERVSQGLVADILRLARGMFDFLVVDTPPQFTDHVLTALDASAVHVLLTTPDIPALKNLRITLDTFDLLELPKHSRLVVLNRSDAKVGLTASDIERVIRVPIQAHVPSSRDVPVSINRGVPIMVDNPQHPVSKAIRDFSLGRLISPIIGEPAARGLRGLLSRNR